MYGVTPLSLAIRSYGADHGLHRHDFAQLVLPIEGALSISVDGREARLDRALAAFVAPGAAHDQESRVANRSLILDLDPRQLAAGAVDRLASRPFLTLGPEAAGLIDYVGLSVARNAPAADKAHLWMPLLLEALGAPSPDAPPRIAALLAALDADPLAAWSVDTMAAKAGLSPSRLHAHFRESLQTTPMAHLAALRLQRAQDWLTATALPIAEIAYRCGYSDQAAFTRALRRATGQTPAALRRQAQELRSSDRQS